MKNKLKVVLVGGTKRAVATIENLILREDIEIVFGIFMLGYEDEKKYADKLAEISTVKSIKYKICDKISKEETQLIESLAPDVILGIGIWRSMLSSEFINIPKYGYLGLHGTALPEYRGFAGINWQIINGASEIKMHALKLDDGIDDGILVCGKNRKPLSYSVNIKNEKHLEEVFLEYEKKHIQAINDMIDLIIRDEINFIPQDHTNATYSCHRGPEDGEINWHQTTDVIFNFIRGQSRPYPGAFTYFKGLKFNIHRARPRNDFSNYAGRIPGKVVSRLKNSDSVIILTTDSAIEILEAEINNCTISPYRYFSSVRDKCKSKVEAYVDILESKEIHL